MYIRYIYILLKLDDNGQSMIMDDIGRAKLQHNDHGYSLPTKEIMKL